METQILLLWAVLFGAALSYDGTTDGEDSTGIPTLAQTTLGPEVTSEEEFESALPGFEVKVTQHGLNYAAQTAIDTLMLKLMNLSIPDMSDEVGPASVGIHSVQVVEFPRPRSSLRLLPGEGLRWRATGISPVIKANYEALVSLGFWEVNKEGIMTVEAKNLRFSLDFFVGRDREGRPTVKLFGCKAGGEIGIKFEGGWSNALNLGSRVFKKKIKSIILNQVCSNAKSEINEKAGWALSKFKLVQDIPPDFEIDFSLVRYPAFRNHSVHAYHKGAFYYKPNKVEPPFEPAEIPFYARHRGKMVYVYITSYVVNTAFHALYTNNKMSGNVTSAQIPPHMQKYFAATCSRGELCLGTLIPELAEYHPNSDVVISVAATQAPNLTIDSGHIRLTGGVTANVQVQEGNTTIKVLSVSLNVTGAVKVTVKNQIIKFYVSDLRTWVDVEYSRLGKTNSEIFGKMLNAASAEILLPMLQDIGGKGIAIPELEYVRLVKPTIINVPRLQDVIIVASDFEVLPQE